MQTLQMKVRDSGSLLERLKECRNRIGRMCADGTPPKMTIPVQWDDDDVFISCTLIDAAETLKALQGSPVTALADLIPSNSTELKLMRKRND